MLVLSRRTNEAIRLYKDGEMIGRIVVIRQHKGYVDIGLKMGLEYEIVREEVA